MFCSSFVGARIQFFLVVVVVWREYTVGQVQITEFKCYDHTPHLIDLNLSFVFSNGINNLQPHIQNDHKINVKSIKKDIQVDNICSTDIQHLEWTQITIRFNGFLCYFLSRKILSFSAELEEKEKNTHVNSEHSRHDITILYFGFGKITQFTSNLGSIGYDFIDGSLTKCCIYAWQ